MAEGVANRDWAGRRESWNWAVLLVCAYKWKARQTEATSVRALQLLASYGDSRQQLAVTSSSACTVKG